MYKIQKRKIILQVSVYYFFALMSNVEFSFENLTIHNTGPESMMRPVLKNVISILKGKFVVLIGMCI